MAINNSGGRTIANSFQGNQEQWLNGVQDTLKEYVKQTFFMTMASSKRNSYVSSFKDLTKGNGEDVTIPFVNALPQDDGLSDNVILSGSEHNLDFQTFKVSIKYTRTAIAVRGQKTSKQKTGYDFQALMLSRLREWKSLETDRSALRACYDASDTFRMFQIGNVDGGLSKSDGSTDLTDLTSAHLVSPKTFTNLRSVLTVAYAVAGFNKIMPAKMNQDMGKTGTMEELNGNFCVLLHPFDYQALKNNTTYTNIVNSSHQGSEGMHPLLSGQVTQIDNFTIKPYEGIRRIAVGSNFVSQNLIFGNEALAFAYASGIEFNRRNDDYDSIMAISCGDYKGFRKFVFTVDGVSQEYGMASLFSFSPTPV